MARASEYNIEKEERDQKYVDEGLSIGECTEYLGCSTTPIEDRLRKFDIPVRSRGNQPITLPEAKLRRLYVEEGLSTTAIAVTGSGRANGEFATRNRPTTDAVSRPESTTALVPPQAV